MGIHALSTLINDDLKPHCDTLNPSKENSKRDYTVVTTVLMKLNDIKYEFRKLLPSKFIDEVPICLVIYNRNCLLNYCNNMKAIQEFVNGQTSNENGICGRENIINLLKRVNSDADYVGNFFSKEKLIYWMTKFTLNKDVAYIKYPILCLNEAIDKMVSITILFDVLFERRIVLIKFIVFI